MHRKLWIPLSMLLPLSALAQPSPQVRALREQVVALQLDHALNLTAQQAQALLPILQDARSQVQAAKSQRQASEAALAAALTQAVADLRASGTISDATVQAVNAARGSAAGAALRSTWQRARAVLTPDQLQALRSTRFGVSASLTATSQARARYGPAQRFHVMHAALSDAFLALVQTRAG